MKPFKQFVSEKSRILLKQHKLYKVTAFEDKGFYVDVIYYFIKCVLIVDGKSKEKRLYVPTKYPLILRFIGEHSDSYVFRIVEGGNTPANENSYTPGNWKYTIEYLAGRRTIGPHSIIVMSKDTILEPLTPEDSAAHEF